MAQVQFLDMPGRRIAYRYTPGREPALVFLPGYMSDMTGSKAGALADWTQARGQACLLLDYSGCGASGGAFADGTLGRWQEEVLAVLDHCGCREVVLVGSSMGGWLMLLVAQALDARAPGRLAGLVGVAAAPDFTRWGFDADQKSALAGGETIYEANPYGPEPTPTYPGFWRDAETRCLLDGTIALDCPVRLINGLADAVVPWETALALANALRSGDVQLALVKGGDHRLSQPQDIALLLRTIEGLLASLNPDLPC